jgi:hypothetical protein
LVRTGTELVEIPAEPPLTDEATDEGAPSTDGATDEDVPSSAAQDASDVTTETRPINPLESFTASVSITANLLAEYADGDAFHAALRRAGFGADVSVDADEDAPLLRIEAEADDAAVAIDTAVEAARALAEDLDRRQDEFGVTDDERIVAEALVVPTRAQRLDTDRDRGLVAVAILGIVVIVTAGLIAEAIARRRRTSHATAAEGSDGDEPASPDAFVPGDDATSAAVNNGDETGGDALVVSDAHRET